MAIFHILHIFDFGSFGLFHYRTEWIIYIFVFFGCSDSFGLFCYCTKWIYQFSHLIFHCLSVHSYLVGLIAVLNVMCVQIVIYLHVGIIGHFAFSMVIIMSIILLIPPWQQRVSLVWVSLATRGFHSNKGFP